MGTASFVPRNNALRILCAAGIALVIFVTLQGPPSLPAQLSIVKTGSVQPPSPPSVEETIAALYKPLIHPFNTSLELAVGAKFPAPPSYWKKPFGKRLCIVDADTRTQDKKGQIWNEKTGFNYTALEHLGAGILNHYLYAKIHGYDYKFIHTQGYHDRAAPWAKLPAVASMLKNYDMLVVVDEDVIFPNLHVPYEWMLNHWNFTDDVAIAMSLEPTMSWWGGSKDPHGRQNQNAGFITIRNIPVAFEMLDRWIRCPEETRYPGCGELKEGWPAEQGAFNNYIRYDYPSQVREIICDEGIGWPGFEPCQGWLVRHYTMNKGDLKHATEESFMNGFLTRVHDHMIQEKNSTYYIMNPHAREEEEAEEEGEK